MQGSINYTQTSSITLNKKTTSLLLVFLLSALRIFSQDSTFTKHIDQIGVNAGVWMPTENKSLGPQSLFGINMNLKKNSHSLSAYADFIALGTKTQDSLTITNNGSFFTTKKISGQQFTLSYGIDILNKNNFSTSLQAGIGHSELKIYTPTEKLRKAYNFFVPGVQFKFQLSKNNSLGLLFQYYLSSYQAASQYPEIKGNYFSVRIIYGTK